MNKKNNGFTLIEAILTLGIISILTMSIYSIYSKIYTNMLIKEQAQLVSQTFTTLNSYFINLTPEDAAGPSAITAAVSPPTALISAKLIPQKMVDTSTTMKTLWGGAITLSGVSMDVTPNDGIANPNVLGYEMTLNNISPEICAKLASEDSIISSSQRITVNGTIVKAPGVSAVNISTLTALCVNANNVIRFANNPFKGVIANNPNLRTTGFRSKERKYYIAPMGTQTNTTGTPSCSGGSSWNATIGACSCASGTDWDGYNCVAIGVAGQCSIGTYWNQTAGNCQPLCAATERLNPVSKVCEANPNPNVTLCIPGMNPANPATPSSIICQTVPSKVTAAITNQAGRNIPSNVFTAITPAFASIATTTTHTAQVSTTMANTNSLAGTTACPIGSRPTFAVAPNNANAGTFTTPTANYDGKNCQMCVSGEWDGDRCVTR